MGDITYDGTFAKLFIACCKMTDMGQYKCHFKNSKGEDETQGKVTVKPAPKAEAPKEPSPVKEPEVQPKKSFLSQKKNEPEPPKQEEKPGEGDMFKLKKKSSVTPRKQKKKKKKKKKKVLALIPLL